MKWELLECRGEQLDALQNAKMIQLNPYEICIFGKGSAAYFDVRDNTATRSKHRSHGNFEGYYMPAILTANG